MQSAARVSARGPARQTVSGFRPGNTRWPSRDHEHRAIPGRVIGSDGDRAVVALVNGTWVTVAVDDPRYLAALQREDLARYRGHELVVLVNAGYGLFRLAVGPALAPSRLAVWYAVGRLEHGSVVEIPGDGSQPGWLLFRCQVEPVWSDRPTLARVH
jgi:hypothetical protein